MAARGREAELPLQRYIGRGRLQKTRGSRPSGLNNLNKCPNKLAAKTNGARTLLQLNPSLAKLRPIHACAEWQVGRGWGSDWWQVVPPLVAAAFIVY